MGSILFMRVGLHDEGAELLTWMMRLLRDRKASRNALQCHRHCTTTLRKQLYSPVSFCSPGPAEESSVAAAAGSETPFWSAMALFSASVLFGSLAVFRLACTERRQQRVSGNAHFRCMAEFCASTC